MVNYHLEDFCPKCCCQMETNISNFKECHTPGCPANKQDNTSNIAKYFRLLEQHDWSYDYSDDYTVSQRGRNEERLLLSLAATDEILKKIFNDYSEYFWKSNRKKPEVKDYE